jgi:hypothetical protein
LVATCVQCIIRVKGLNYSRRQPAHGVCTWIRAGRLYLLRARR